MASKSRSDAAASLDDSYRALLANDPALGAIAAMLGRPDPFVWAGEGKTGKTMFAAMVLHIASQQISTAVALVVFGRIEAAVGGVVDPRGIADLGPDRLRSLGLSRAKAAYITNLAEMHLAGTLDTERLGDLDDDSAIAALTSARGVGLWTAQMFLIHQLRRPDVLPAGDLGIRRAVQAISSSADVPSIEEVSAYGLRWAPRRTYAAALLWASLRPMTADITG